MLTSVHCVAVWLPANRRGSTRQSFHYFAVPGAPSDQILCEAALEFLRGVRHMRILGFTSKGGLYSDKGGVSSVY